MLNLSVIILTGNEELHIARCLCNVVGFAKDVFVVDSFSTDWTQEIVESFSEKNGTTIHFARHEWPGFHAPQFNWALNHLPIQTEWVLRLDADEMLTDELKAEIQSKLSNLSADMTGVVLKRRHIFCGRWVKAGTYPVKLLRLFRRGKAVCEQRMMDEHMLLTEGQSLEFAHDFIDQNLNNLSWWAQKHVGYAVREAADLLDMEYNLFPGTAQQIGMFGKKGDEKRLKKLKYSRLPLFWRAFAYFCLRYFIKGGWRDGIEGFLWHFLQGFWYRTLVDANIFEIKRKVRTIVTQSGESDVNQVIVRVLREDYGMNV